MPPLTSELVRGHALRMAASSALSKSARLSQVFHYLLDETLAGRGASITQQSIAVDAMGYGPDFDPGKNPIARVQAGRLRRILAEYPWSEDVVVEMPAGGYALRFLPARKKGEGGADAALPVVAMVEFQGIDLEACWARLTDLFCKELGSSLAGSAGLEWFGVFSRARLEREQLEPVALGRSYPVMFLVDGSIQQSSGGFILRARLLEGATGMQVWAWKSPERVAAAGLAELAADLARWIVEVVAKVAPPVCQTGGTSAS